MEQVKLRNMRFDGRWFKITSFATLDKCNQFLEANSDFGLLKIAKTFSGGESYVVARNDDKGTEKLKIIFEDEDTGYCAKYYRADCGRLFVHIPDGLHTCQDDDWREPCNKVDADFFELAESA